MNTQAIQLPNPSLPISMMIAETAYRIVVSVERLIRKTPR